jgi:hypothetical protein
LFGGIGSAWLARLHSGGWDNVLIPLHAVLALLGVLGYLAARRAAARLPAVRLLLAVLLIFQFALLRYPPSAQVPSQADRAAGEAFIATLRAVDGDVFIPYHGHYAPLAGKPAWVQGAALTDVIRGKDRRLSDQGHDLLRHALATGRFAALILDEPMPELDQVEHPYVDVGPIWEDSRVFWPVTGRPTRPERLLLRQEAR